MANSFDPYREALVVENHTIGRVSAKTGPMPTRHAWRGSCMGAPRRLPIWITSGSTRGLPA